MTINELKFKIKKIFPSFIFDFVYKIWRNIIQPILNLMYKIRLVSFKKETFKKLNIFEKTFFILLNPKNGTVDKEIYLHGVYEPFFLKVIKENLNEGDIYIDIGMNIGQHALFASRCVGISGKVYGFEPIEYIYNQVQKSIEKNKSEYNDFNNIEIFNNGCGNLKEDLKINISDSNAGSSSLVATYDSDNSEIVKIDKLDNLLKDIEKVNFIKIDVEGFEYEALLGAENIINKYKPKILIEYSPYYYIKNESSKENGVKIFNFLKSFDYKIYDLENNNKEVDIDYLDNINKNLDQTNFLCV